MGRAFDICSHLRYIVVLTPDHIVTHPIHMLSTDFATAVLAREPLYERVANQIIHSIVQQRLPVGTRLPSERSMSEQFGVSRVVIREAMKVLVKNGVITVEPGRGTFISDRINDSLLRSLDLICRLQGVDSHQLFEVRSPLEIVIARLAATRATPQEIATLEAYTDEMERTLDDLERHRAANEKFHLTLAAATKNELFPNLLQPLVVLMKETRVLMSEMPEVAQCAVAHHRRLVEAIKQGDAQKAEEAMKVHLEDGARFLAMALARHPPHQRCSVLENTLVAKEGIYIHGVFKGSFGNIGNVIVTENIENETAQPGKAVGIGTNP